MDTFSASVLYFYERACDGLYTGSDVAAIVVATVILTATVTSLVWGILSDDPADYGGHPDE